MTIDTWISRFDNEEVGKLSQDEQIEIRDMLIELKERREQEDKELEERSLEIERNDWERESNAD